MLLVVDGLLVFSVDLCDWLMMFDAISVFSTLPSVMSVWDCEGFAIIWSVAS